MRRICPIKAFFTGVIVGSVITALTTPTTGRQLQDELILSVRRLNRKISEFDVHNIEFSKEMFLEKLDAVKQSIENIDWETSREVVMNKYEEIADRLAEIKWQLTESIEEAVEDVTDKVEEVLDEVAEKLETT